MKRIKIIALVLLVVFIGIQFISTERNQSNVTPVTDILKTYKVPDRIGTIFKTSCYDCHSNNTVYPWYNKIQPVAWFLEGHVKEGKEELDFSEFGSYSKRRQKSKLKSIGSQVKDGEMPLWSYTLIHQKAKLSKGDKKIVIDWVNKLRDSL